MVPFSAKLVFLKGFCGTDDPTDREARLTDEELAFLLIACETDDRRLTQGSTTTPPPLMCVQDWPVEGGCALCFAYAFVDGVKTVGETEERFAALCYAADSRLGEPAGCRWFLNWFDETARPEALSELAVMIREVQAIRANTPTREQALATLAETESAFDANEIF